MNQSSLCRRMATKWLEIAEEIHNPALKKCYIEKALKYQMMAAMYEKKEDKSPPPAGS